MSNAPPRKTAAQQAWRRMRDRDIAAALSDRKRQAAHGVTMQPHEPRAELVLPTSTTPDSVHGAERAQHALTSVKPYTSG